MEFYSAIKKKIWFHSYVKSNNWTNTPKRDNFIDGKQMTVSGGVVGGGIKQQAKGHGHGQWCGDCWGEWGIRGLNGNEKNTIKIKF